MVIISYTIFACCGQLRLAGETRSLPQLAAVAQGVEDVSMSALLLALQYVRIDDLHVGQEAAILAHLLDRILGELLTEVSEALLQIFGHFLGALTQLPGALLDVGAQSLGLLAQLLGALLDLTADALEEVTHLVLGTGAVAQLGELVGQIGDGLGHLRVAVKQIGLARRDAQQQQQQSCQQHVSLQVLHVHRGSLWWCRVAV